MFVNAYLQMAGTCRDAFTFYQSVLGGELTLLDHSMMGDQVPDDWKTKILHAHLAIGEASLQGSDRPGDPEKAQGFAVSVNVETVAEAERIFMAFADGGGVEMPMTGTFFAEAFGALTDRFGTPWMIVGASMPAPS
jgi:PhnB protein